MAQQGQQQPLQVPPEPAFQTTNGLRWVLKCQGKQLTQLSTGPAEIPVYSELGCGQFGRVFEVLPSPPAASVSSEAPPTVAATAVEASQTATGPGAPDAAAASGGQPAAGAPAAANAEPAGRPPPALPPGQLYAAKLLLLSNFEADGTTADLIREFSLYGELDTPGGEGSGFANVLRVYGATSCVRFSKPFAEAYLSGVQTAGILVVERCASDLAAFARLLHAQGKLNHSALKFYAWQLLNGRLFESVVYEFIGTEIFRCSLLSVARLLLPCLAASGCPELPLNVERLLGCIYRRRPPARARRHPPRFKA